MAGAQTRMAEAQGQTAAGTMTEAPGQLPVLADDPATELAKGKTAVHPIDWIAGGSEVSVRRGRPLRRPWASWDKRCGRWEAAIGWTCI